MYTIDLHRDIVHLVREGNFITTVCKLVGISRSTFYNWMEKGAEGIEPYVQFHRDVTRAEGELERDLTGDLLSKCRYGDRDTPHLKAMEYYLGKRFPAEWSDDALLNKQVEAEIEAILNLCKEKMSITEYNNLIDILNGTEEDN